MSHLLQHRPTNISLIAHKPISNEGQVIAEVQNYVRFSHAQASGHTRLSSASLHEHVVASPEFNEGFEEKQARQNGKFCYLYITNFSVIEFFLNLCLQYQFVTNSMRI